MCITIIKNKYLLGKEEEDKDIGTTGMDNLMEIILK